MWNHLDGAGSGMDGDSSQSTSYFSEIAGEAGVMRLKTLGALREWWSRRRELERFRPSRNRTLVSRVWICIVCEPIGTPARALS